MNTHEVIKNLEIDYGISIQIVVPIKDFDNVSKFEVIDTWYNVTPHGFEDENGIVSLEEIEARIVMSQARQAADEIRDRLVELGVSFEEYIQKPQRTPFGKIPYGYEFRFRGFDVMVGEDFPGVWFNGTDIMTSRWIIDPEDVGTGFSAVLDWVKRFPRTVGDTQLAAADIIRTMEEARA